jgi:hypothetical protein
MPQAGRSRVPFPIRSFDISNYLIRTMALESTQPLNMSTRNLAVGGWRPIGGWVGTRAGLDVMEKCKLLILPGLEPQPLGRPACNQSLYRLPRLYYTTLLQQCSPSCAKYAARPKYWNCTHPVCKQQRRD